MVLIASHRDHRIDAGRLAGLDVLLAAVARVGDQTVHGAQHFGLCLERRQHRLDLLFVIGGFLAFQFLDAGEAVIVSDSTKTALENLGITANQTFNPVEIVGTENLFTLKGIAILLGGGLLIGFGTRWANGCTSGHAISGLSDLQLPSLVAVIGFFIGGLIMTHLLIPVILGK